MIEGEIRHSDKALLASTADDLATLYSIAFVDILARPIGFMGQSFGRGGDDATGAKATFWILHHLLVNGEAAAGLSDAFRRQYEQLPWRKIIGMRNGVL